MGEVKGYSFYLDCHGLFNCSGPAGTGAKPFWGFNRNSASRRLRCRSLTVTVQKRAADDVGGQGFTPKTVEHRARTHAK